jgi:hypothetical protein
MTGKSKKERYLILQRTFLLKSLMTVSNLRMEHGKFMDPVQNGVNYVFD